MRLHSTASHLELACDLVIVAALQQQLGNLLLPRAQADRAFLHAIILPSMLQKRTLGPKREQKVSESLPWLANAKASPLYFGSIVSTLGAKIRENVCN